MNVDLNEENYDYDGLLELFSLPHDFNHQHLKQAKKKVLLLHPDKSHLEEKYFLFFRKMYQKIEEEGAEMPSKKSNSSEIDAFFKKIVPNYDKEKVYNSDILKLCSWYKILSEQMDLSELQPAQGEEQETNEQD